MMRTLIIALALAAMLAGTAPAGASETRAWRALGQPGHALLIRHASAPGGGDPPDFELGDCATQRNLGDAGRAQARRLGERLRARGVEARDVFTSRWCRCRETAELLDVGPVEPLDGLNSFYGPQFTEAQIMPQLRRFLRTRALDPPPVLVTHQVNITALTGVFPREGEMIVVAVDGDRVEVVGRIPPPE